jgi:CPA1 family monovalent cation:H+ antiporter
MVFLLIGIEVHIVEMLANWKVIAVATGAVLLGRILAVYLLTPVSNLFTERVPVKWQHVMVWGGLHGSVSIALALSLPQDFPERALLLTMTFGVAAFSIVVQGLTMQPLLAWLGLGRRGEDEYMMLKAQQLSLAAAGMELQALRGDHIVSENAYHQLRGELEERVKEISGELSTLQEDRPTLMDEEVTMARRRLVDAKRGALQRAVINGVIPPRVGEHLLADAAREMEALPRSHDGT